MTQAIFDGLLTGGLYAAFAIGLSLIFGVTRVISAVHGAFIIVGAYLAYTANSLFGIDPFLTIPGLIVIGFGLGYAVQRGVINAVVKRNVLMTVTLTFGLDLIFMTVVLLVWGADLRIIRLDYADAGFTILGARISYVRLIIFAIAVVLTIALDLVVRKTDIGARIRAVSQDRPAAELLGIDTNHTYGIAHGLAAGVACAAGAMVAVIVPLQPFLGIDFLLIAFAVVILAGFGPIAPVFLAAILLGLSEQFAGLYFGTEFQRLAIFVVYLAVATVRPRGLFGTRFYAH